MTSSCLKVGCIYMYFLHLIVLIVQLYSKIILKIRSNIRLKVYLKRKKTIMIILS